MSVINPNQFSTGFASPSVLSELDTSAPAQHGGYAAGSAQRNDSILWNPISLPIESPVIAGPGSGNYGTGSPATSGWSFSGIMNEIGNLVSNLLTQLGNAIGSQESSLGSTTTPSGHQQYFSNATGSSTGDPHLTFDGTTGTGAAVNNSKWDSMTSHDNLLSSDSFGGGYRVSTQATTPNANGIAYNENATITTDGGAAAVTMQKDGSYSVTENGSNIALTAGQSTSLGNGETVELNHDGSLTVSDANGAGGTISTTLKSNGDGGVDVSNKASGVDLGAYLIDKSDSDYDPFTQTGGITTGPISTGPISYTPEQPLSEYQLQSLAGPSVGNLSQFDPDEQSTQLGNIEYA